MSMTGTDRNAVLTREDYNAELYRLDEQMAESKRRQTEEVIDADRWQTEQLRLLKMQYHERIDRIYRETREKIAGIRDRHMAERRELFCRKTELTYRWNRRQAQQEQDDQPC